MADDGRIGLITCVGMRALAAVTPLQTWLTTVPQTGRLDVVLLSTRQSKAEVDKITAWFAHAYPGIPVRSADFDASPGSIADLCRGMTSVYYLVNPGMSHQVAAMALVLPLNTRCLASDNAQLYEWPLTGNIRHAKKSVLRDLGVEAASLLLHERRFECNWGQNRKTLAPSVLTAMKGLQRPGTWTLRFLGSRAQEVVPGDDVSREISHRIIWVTESTGRLFVLFDLTNEAASKRGRNAKSWLLQTYRAIVAESENAFVPFVVADRSSVIERARIDRVDCLDISNPSVSLELAISGFAAGELLPTPKRTIPTAIRRQAGELLDIKNATPPIVRGTRILFTGMGDNVLPTLKALLSADANGTSVVFVDRKTPYIVWCAKRMRDVLRPRQVHLVGTDHLGSGMLEWIRSHSDGGDCEFNVTPGSKTMALALAVAARTTNRRESVCSLLRSRAQDDVAESVVRVLDGAVIRPAQEPTLSELIRCHIPPQEHQGDELYKLALWKRVLEGLASGQIVAADCLMRLRGSGDGFFVRQNRTAPLFVTVGFPGRAPEKYELSPPFFDEDNSAGIWWEAVVANAFHDSGIASETFWQYTWAWPPDSEHAGSPLSELDVICRIGGEIVAVSCKAQRKMHVETWAASVLAEARLRFGRLPLCFIAVPFEEDARKRRMKGLEVGNVDVLTPSILNNPNELRKAIDNLRARLRTTS